MLALGPAWCGAAPAAQVIAIDAGQFREVLERHRGEVVLVNFWATWCRPCLKEIPDLLALENRYRDRGLRLVPVSLDEPADLDRSVLPFLRKWFPEFRSYLRLTPDMDGMVSVVDPAWNELLPTSYVIDRGGTVRVRLQGGKPRAAFEVEILPLLDSP
jgi:thiol-disulfide isomerase/thioredoxin